MHFGHESMRQPQIWFYFPTSAYGLGALKEVGGEIFTFKDIKIMSTGIIYFNCKSKLKTLKCCKNVVVLSSLNNKILTQLDQKKTAWCIVQQSFTKLKSIEICMVFLSLVEPSVNHLNMIQVHHSKKGVQSLTVCCFIFSQISHSLRLDSHIICKSDVFLTSSNSHNMWTGLVFNGAGVVASYFYIVERTFYKGIFGAQ